MDSKNKDCVLSVRVSNEEKKFIDLIGLSPSRFFRESLAELMNDQSKIGAIKMEQYNSSFKDKKFTICQKCNVIFLGKKEDIEKGNRLCLNCQTKKKKL